MKLIHPTVTVVLRSFGRPLRTRRMLECINAQTVNNFELIFIGDACPSFRELIKSDWFDLWKSNFQRKGNHLFYMNNAIGGRDYGAKITNQAIKLARGHYFMFLDNDDMITPEHIEFYYKSIIRTGADFVYNPVVVNGPDGLWRRVLDLRSGCVGHAELIVKTEFLRKMPPHAPMYGQDWLLVLDMMAVGTEYLKGSPPFPTYKVMSTDKYKEPQFENDN